MSSAQLSQFELVRRRKRKASKKDLETVGLQDARSVSKAGGLLEHVTACLKAPGVTTRYSLPYTNQEDHGPW